MNNTLKTRFAPSPTGLMHFGNLRTALFNYLYAKRFGGIFLLRVEDTDLNRSEVQFRDAILTDLSWLGLNWQEGPFYQSERQAIYNAYYQTLEKEGRVYHCFCTEEQLALTRKVQMASHQAPRYPGTCRNLSKEAVQAKHAAGIPYTLRFEVSMEQKIQFEDLIKGSQEFDTDHIGDFIIRRGDGSASFMFCNAIDDALMGVTHALRGDDHLTNTPRQILISKALGLKSPQYGHFPTIFGPDSRPLSKRNGSRSIQDLRVEGFQPTAILNYLSRLGHHDSDPKLLDLNTLCEHFDLNHISSSPAHYDAHQLNHWQKESMYQSSKESCWSLIADYVNKWVPQSKIEAFVDTVQPNLVMPKDALPWAEVIFGDTLSFQPEVMQIMKEAGAEFFKTALAILKNPNITFKDLVNELQIKTNRKGKLIFFPLRAALTAELHGPELAKVLDLMGIDKARLRLAKAVEYAENL